MAEKKENSQEKKGIAAWLELSEEARANFTAWLGNNSGGFSCDSAAAVALEELAELRELVDALPPPAPCDANDRRNYQRLCDLLGID